MSGVYRLAVRAVQAQSARKAKIFAARPPWRNNRDPRKHQMARPNQKRTSEQRYYTTVEEAEVITRAAAIAGQSKSDYCRAAILQAAVSDLSRAGEDIPKEIRHRHERNESRGPAMGDSERKIIEAFDSIRDLLIHRHSK